MSDPMKVVILGNLSSLLLLKETTASQFKAYVTNKETPLFDRWNFFIEYSSELLQRSNYLGDLGKHARAYLDGSNYYRHETRYFSDIFEEESYHPSGEEDEEWKSYVESWVEEHKDLIEEILSSGYSGFTWDW